MANKIETLFYYDQIDRQPNHQWQQHLKSIAMMMNKME